MKFAPEFARMEYTDSVGNILEVHETIDGVDLGIQGEHVHIEAEDAVGIAQAILHTKNAEFTVVPGKLPEVIFNTDGEDWEHRAIIKDSFPLRYYGLWKADTAFIREEALDMLAFADAIEDYNDSEAKAAKLLEERRNAWAIKVGSSPLGYADTFDSTQSAIDQIIALEDKLAAKEQAA